MKQTIKYEMYHAIYLNNLHELNKTRVSHYVIVTLFVQYLTTHTNR